jgi:hypothetical protein
VTRSLSESLGGGSPDQWALDFLARAGFEATPANVQVVVSWEYAESSGGGGMWNPLNTTQGGYPGETDFNSVGVKNYPTRDVGVQANARVIHNGYYPHVVERFLAGDDARATADAITASPWGTGHIELVGTPHEPVASPPVPTFTDPPIMLANPLGGAWVARSDGVVYFVNNQQTIVVGGMSTPADRKAFGNRTVKALRPRAYGPGGRLHGYTIVATSGETYVPELQR